MFSVKQPCASKSATTKNGGLPSCVCAMNEEIIKAYQQNVDVCGTTVTSKDVWLCEPILVHAFNIVVLFVCAHSFVEECLMHSCLEFVCVPVCSFGMYWPGKCAGAFTIPGVKDTKEVPFRF